MNEPKQAAALQKKDAELVPQHDGNHMSFNFLQMAQDSPIAIYSCDKDGYITFYNKAAVHLWGRTPEIGKDLWCGSWKIFYPDGRPMPLDECPMAKTLKDGTAFENKEITIETPGHIFKNLLVFPRPLFDEQNRINGAHNTLVDITEKYSGDTRQAILSAIVESSDDAIISKDLKGIVLTWNNGAERIFGYTEAEMIGKSITLLIPPARINEEYLILDSIVNGRRVDHIETLRVHKDGHEIPISLTVSPIKDNYGNVMGASKIARDITEQLRSKILIKKNTENLETLNSIGKGISEKLDIPVILQRVIDATTQITGADFGVFFYNSTNELNESFMRFTLSGISKNDFEKFGMPQNTETFGNTFNSQGAVRISDITKNQGYIHNHPYYNVPKDHLPIVSYLAVPVISTTGIPIGGLFFGHSAAGVFTAEHESIVNSIASQAAVALDNSRLFEEIKDLNNKKDEFIALASHELKTPLTTVKGYLQILAKTDHNKMDKLFIEKSLYQIEKLNTLIEDLLNVSKIEAGKLEFSIEAFDITQLLLGMIDIFRYSNKTHEIRYNIPNHQVIVEADKQRIEQVVINLLNNAIKYSPKANKIYLNLELTDESVIVKIKDEGIGLTLEDQRKIFSRFYRAESVRGIGGLGLGLYLTKQIIDRHMGKIEVSSEFGKGSEFCFSLPLKYSEPILSL